MAGLRVFVMEGDSLIADRRFGDEPVTVGSDGGCSIHLPDLRLAKLHLRLAPTGPGQWRVEPLEKAFAASLNGFALVESQPIKDRDEVAVGSFKLKLFLADAAKSGSGQLRPATTARAPEFALPVGAFARSPGGVLKLPCEVVSTLAGLTADVAGLSHTEAMLGRILPALISQFHASAASARIRQRTADALEVVRAADVRGRPVDEPKLARHLYENCTRLKHRVCLPGTDEPGIASAMGAPILGAKGAALGMLYVESSDAGAPYDGDTLDALAAFAAAVAHPIERCIQGVTAAQVEVAQQSQLLHRALQDAITPRAMPEWPDLHVAVYRRPGSVRCRDFYDVLRLANSTAAVLVARIDAPGPMVPRFMAELRAAFRTSSLHADPPHVLIRAINWLAADAHVRWTIDAASVWVTPGSGAIKYCVAGAGVSVGMVHGDGDFHELEPCQMPSIGRERGYTYQSKAGHLQPGDVLAVLTDGADSLKAADGQVLGRERLGEMLCDAAGTAVNLMLTDIDQELNEFAAGGACPEDVTVLLTGH